MGAGIKRSVEDATEHRKPKVSRTKNSKSEVSKTETSEPETIMLSEDSYPAHFPVSMHCQLARIDASQRTPFEKSVWTALCQIPQGHFTTYALLAAYLKSSPRAVGNALRRNPFAPGVPCHRVVATGGALGGFKGKWPKDGEGITIDEKKKLLRGEGIRLDDKGRVKGTPFCGFV